MSATVTRIDPKAQRHIALLKQAALRVELAAHKGDEKAGNRAIDDFDSHYRALLAIRGART